MIKKNMLVIAAAGLVLLYLVRNKKANAKSGQTFITAGYGSGFVNASQNPQLTLPNNQGILYA